MEQDQGETTPLAQFGVVLITIRGKSCPEYAWKHATHLGKENKTEDRLPGTYLIEEDGRDVSMEEFLPLLLQSGLRSLAGLQKYLHYSEMSNKNTSMLRYVFRRGETQAFASPVHDSVIKELQDWFVLNMWSVRVFDNACPDGARMLSIELSGRQPLYEGATLRRVWVKDAEGNRVGDAPVELKPTLFLSTQPDGQVCIFEEAAQA